MLRGMACMYAAVEASPAQLQTEGLCACMHGDGCMRA